MSTDLQPAAAMVPGGNVNAYLQAIGGVAVLTAEQERELTGRLYYENDLEAARRLVLSHLRFVVHIAKSYNGYGLPLSDLIQEGNVGLMKAVKRFNPEVGVRLVSFAVHWIKAEIHEFILRNWRIVKVATTKAQRKLFFNLRKSKKTLNWLSHEEAKSVASDLGVDVTEVNLMEGRMSASDAAFDGYGSDDDDADFAPAQYLEDRAADPADLVERSDWADSREGQLKEALSGLDDRSRDIIASRWLGDKKATLHDLAARYGVSAERIRQLEANAMKKVRAQISA